jgi:fructose/tagatose bisphosphate aldolase
MLLTGTEPLHLAAKQGWALAAFAVYNLEMVQAIVAAAEEADRPVLLLAGSSHFHHAGQTAMMNVGLPRSTSTLNYAAPTSPQSNVHCRRRCRTLTPSQFGKRHVPLSRPWH